MNNDLNNKVDSNIQNPDALTNSVVPNPDTYISSTTVEPVVMTSNEEIIEEVMPVVNTQPIDSLAEVEPGNYGPIPSINIGAEVEPVVNKPIVMAEPVSMTEIVPEIPTVTAVETEDHTDPIQQPVVPPVVPVNLVPEETDDSFIPKKKDKANIFLVISAIVVLLLLICLGAYYFYSKSEKVILGNSIKLLENFKGYLNSPFVLDDSEELSESGNISVKMTSENTEDSLSSFTSILNNMSFDYEFSKTSSNTLLNVGINKDSKLLGGIKLYSTKETGYIFLDKIFDKYIEMEELKDALSSTNYNDTEDYKYLYNFIMDSLVSNINSEDFKTGKASIEIDGKSKSVNSLKLEYNDKQIADVVGLVIEDIRNDEKANTIVTAMYADFKTLDVKDSVASIDEEHMSKYTYTVYTNSITNSVEGIDFNYNYYEETYNYDKCGSYEDDTSLDNMNNTFENIITKGVLYEDETTIEDYTTDEYTEDYDYSTYYEDCMTTDFVAKSTTVEYRNDSNSKIYVKEDGNLLGYVELVKDNDTLTINIYGEDDKKLGYVKITSNSELFAIEASFSDETNEFKFDLTTNIKEVSKGKEYNLDTEATFSSYTNKVLDEKMTFNITSNIKNSAKVNENVTGSVKYDELTEAQTEEILNNLLNIVSEAGLQ